MMKKFMLLFLMLFCVLVVSGCGKVDYTVEMNEDGSNQVITRVTMTNAAAKLGGISEVRKQLSQVGYTVSTKQNGGNTIVEGVKKVPQGDLVFPFVDQYVKGEPTIISKYNNYFFFKTFEFNAACELDPKMKQRLPDNVSLTVNLPGTIMQSNAAIVEKNPLQWVVNKADTRVTAVAKSRVIHYERIAGLFIIGILVFWYRKRKG